MIEIRLPFPPSTNSLWTRSRKGMRLTDKYRAWLDEAGWIVKAAKVVPFSGAYCLCIDATRPDRRRRDIDNTLKSVSDLMVKMGVVKDDSLCEMVSARWVDGAPGVLVTIEPAN